MTEFKCCKFGTKDIVTGLFDYDDASNCRRDEKKCGIQGNYHEELSTFQYHKKCILTIAYYLRIPFICLGGFFVYLIFIEDWRNRTDLEDLRRSNSKRVYHPNDL
jgi:hypothetical protein